MRKPQTECADYPNAVGGGMLSPSALLFLIFPRELRGSNWICACSRKVELPFSLVLESLDDCLGGKMNREECQKSQETSAAVS